MTALVNLGIEYPLCPMKDLIDALCSNECAGRKTASPGGRRAKGLIVDALRGVGLDPAEQPVPVSGGINVLATVPGDIDRWVLVAAHYDHLGASPGGAIYRGADDNAAAVAMLVELARSLTAKRPTGRGVMLAFFDAEEPPWFTCEGMGSQHFVRAPTVPLDRIDLMVCLELMGHALGVAGLPASVRNTLFLLGAERSEGTGALVDRIATSESGVIVRRADAEIIPPLSDYDSFWRKEVPFVLLTNARSRHYHTPQDTPEHLDLPKMQASARWIERLVRDTCAREEPRVRFCRGVKDDLSTLRSLEALTRELAPFSAPAKMGHAMATQLLKECDARGQLPSTRRATLGGLIGALESGLA